MKKSKNPIIVNIIFAISSIILVILYSNVVFGFFSKKIGYDKNLVVVSIFFLTFCLALFFSFKENTVENYDYKYLTCENHVSYFRFVYQQTRIEALLFFLMSLFINIVLCDSIVFSFFLSFALTSVVFLGSYFCGIWTIHHPTVRKHFHYFCGKKKRLSVISIYFAIKMRHIELIIIECVLVFVCFFIEFYTHINSYFIPTIFSLISMMLYDGYMSRNFSLYEHLKKTGMRLTNHLIYECCSFFCITCLPFYLINCFFFPTANNVIFIFLYLLFICYSMIIVYLTGYSLSYSNKLLRNLFFFVSIFLLFVPGINLLSPVCGRIKLGKGWNEYVRSN